ncbi:uncharacterized protein LOC141657242 [Silene latifolia]|uniref:uncharacterized protein LOC141657242 n=1 Tax=Silene latifolia TaxID=37657 RepID=UPI003D76B876
MDGHGAALKTDTYEKGKPGKDVNNVPEDRVCTEDTKHYFINDRKYGKDGEHKKVSQHIEPPSGEVNMEAIVDPDDVIRAGGFGARDGLSSVLPMASDSTDFESSLLDMRDYEEPEGERRRPGLGWSKDKESE